MTENVAYSSNIHQVLKKVFNINPFSHTTVSSHSPMKNTEKINIKAERGGYFFIRILGSIHKRTLLLPLLIFLTVPAAATVAPKLFAAAGKADITPDLESETIFLAGYGASGRRATGIHDPLYVRAMVVSDGEKTVALVAVDSIGIFRQDVLDIRTRLGWKGKNRYLLLAATHDHSAPDTLGLWGRFPGVSGVDKRYQARLKKTVVELVKDLSSKLQEAEMSAGKRMLDPRGLCRDSRDPIVIDPELNVLSFKSRKGRPIGTLVRWSCHPEVMGDDNLEVTADFPGALCAKIEEKTGGACLFFAGSVGGLMSPDVDHHAMGPQAQFEASRRLGEKIADAALASLKKPDRWTRGKVSFETKIVDIPVENSRYLLFLHSLRFGHEIYNTRGEPLSLLATTMLSLRHLAFYPLSEELRPRVKTEVSLINIGPVRLLGIPGEIFPELVIGGFGGKYRYGYPLVGPTNQNPPDLEKAPKGPYLRQRLKAEHGIVVGLANDEMGYFVPSYDFVVTPTRSMTPRPEGTHYEETNSTGKKATAIILDAARELLDPNQGDGL